MTLKNGINRDILLTTQCVLSVIMLSILSNACARPRISGNNDFTHKLFNEESVWRACVNATEIQLFRLPDIYHSAYFSYVDEKWHLSHYPEMTGPIEHKKELMQELIGLITGNRSYYQEKVAFGVGPLMSNAMLTIREGKDRIDILLWFHTARVDVVVNGIKVNGAFMVPDSQSDLVKIGMKLFPDDETLWDWEGFAGILKWKESGNQGKQ
jgi:hypothetical protein